MPIIFLLVAFGVWWGVRSVRRRRELGPPPEQGPVGWTVGTRWLTLVPLARAENRRLIRQPTFVTGIVLTPLMLWAATIADHTSRGHWRGLSADVALALVPLGWFTIVATNLLVLRPSHTGIAELFAALPAPQPVRTAGALSAMAAAGAAAVLFATGWVIFLGVRGGAVGAPQWGEIGAGVLVVIGAVTVGVAVGRWLPFAAFGIVAAVTVSVIQARFLDDTTWPWNMPYSHPVRFLGFLAEPTSVGDPALEIRPAWWHLVYLAALITVMCAVALARDGVPRQLGAVLVAAVGVAVAAGWAQTRPPSADQVAAMVGYITRPTDHQACEQREGVRYCAYPSSRHLIDEWDARVTGVLALVPPSVAHRPVEVIQRIPTTIGSADCTPRAFLAGLPAEVVDLLSPHTIWPDDGNLHPDFGNGSFPCNDRPTNNLFTAVQAGAWAVGLPPAPHDDDQRCMAEGQARPVLALWLAAAATPDGGELLRDLSFDAASSSGALTFDEWDNPPMWGVVYTASDASLAIAMLEQPARPLADALAEDWQRWVDPATPSTDLARHLGL
ncbi:MAG: hypothetical protein ABIO83_11355, partial [Ilumatobacteraceae bacterium]